MQLAASKVTRGNLMQIADFYVRRAASRRLGCTNSRGDSRYSPTFYDDKPDRLWEHRAGSLDMAQEVLEI